MAVETGSLDYGSGLKSFRVKDKKITVEEFGKCSAEEQKINWQCGSKFSAKDVVRKTFGSAGKKFVQKSTETIISPASNVKNYQPEINISD